jgi:hypothetical protein
MEPPEMSANRLLTTLKMIVVCVLPSLLAAGARSAEKPALPAPAAVLSPQRLFAVCELYAPGHFGNSYEVLGPNQMRAVLAEAGFWGFNRYGDWFDMDDCKDPFASGHTYGLGDALWESKKTNFGSAQTLGLLRDLLLTPNHVFVDQCLPEVLAVKGGRVFGQVICPSKPKARQLILKDYEDLFADLARSGVRLTHLNAAPYDFGGCRCKQCDPWILTFAQLSHEIYAIARKYHPQIKMDMIGWWWTAEEHRLLAEWVDQHAPGWVERMYLHLPYGATKIADVRLPKGCQPGAFVHISYAEQASPRDVYGHLGPIVAAQRLQQTVADLKAQGVTGIVAYSEGVFEDLNKAILAGLASGRYRTADEVLAAYARRYFGVDADTARLWDVWLKAWGKPFDVDLRQSAATLAMLLKKTPQGDWRLRQWELKQQLFAIHREIGPGNQWTPARLAAVERFWAVQEEIQRDLWGLAPLRHALSRRYTPLPWYASWAKFKATQVQVLGKEQ